MNNKTLMISSSLLATSLFLGAGVAQANTTTNNNMNQQDMAMNEQMGHMNNNMNQQDMEMNEQMGQTTMMPYYNYDGQFTQAYDFVSALQHDNVMIDGYKVNTAASDKDVASSKAVYDSMIDMNKDGQVIHITFETKPDTVSKEMFEKDHMTNHMVDEGTTTDGSYMTYETNNGMYQAFFDKHGYLMKVMIR